MTMPNREELKLCRKIVALIDEMATLTPDQGTRFVVVQKQLARLARQYKEMTGKDNLQQIVEYGRAPN